MNKTVVLIVLKYFKEILKQSSFEYTQGKNIFTQMLFSQYQD